ncbi:Uncharacterised protein [Mesomycoplasma neurolyticum]|uniref:Uncharacterized protein n=2 Tax=Mesomycoplasma neurolyticum TaxID=2120 RepID=A0A449A6B2_9BACT|nr:Uncharacterised protein [Mesomycoplasma neurolyticum]
MSNLFQKHISLVEIAAKKAKFLFKNIPIEYEDLYVVGLGILNKLLSQKLLIPSDNPNAWLYKRIYLKLLEYCKKFTSSNHKIMNYKSDYADEKLYYKNSSTNSEFEYLNFKEIETKDFFKNFSDEKKSILWMYFVEKIAVKQISKLLYISSNKINDLIKTSKKLAINYINDQ